MKNSKKVTTATVSVDLGGVHVSLQEQVELSTDTLPEYAESVKLDLLLKNLTTLNNFVAKVQNEN